MRWVERIQARRNKWLARDEIRDVENFYLLVLEFCKLIPDFEASFGREHFELDNNEAWRQLTAIENARIAAEENILEETEEDAGM